MKLHPIPVIFLLFLCTALPGTRAQTQGMTLRQAIDQALGQNPQAAISDAYEKDASAAAALAHATDAAA